MEKTCFIFCPALNHSKQRTKRFRRVSSQKRCGNTIGKVDTYGNAIEMVEWWNGYDGGQLWRPWRNWRCPKLSGSFRQIPGFHASCQVQLSASNSQGWKQILLPSPVHTMWPPHKTNKKISRVMLKPLTTHAKEANMKVVRALSCIMHFFLCELWTICWTPISYSVCVLCLILRACTYVMCYSANLPPFNPSKVVHVWFCTKPQNLSENTVKKRRKC